MRYASWYWNINPNPGWIMSIVVSFSCLCLLLLAGNVLRQNVKILRKLYLPSSVIGGVLGLIVIQLLGDRMPASISAGWNKLPGFLINIVFAALFLGVTIPPVKEIWKRSGVQLAYGQIVAWGQYVVGLGISILLLAPLFGTPKFLGVIVPVGFEGGHGTAGGLGPTFSIFNWSQGTDYALTSATAGIVFAIVVGVVLINWAARRKITSRLRNVEDIEEFTMVEVFDPSKRPVAGYQTVNPESVDSLALHIAIVGMAILIGYGLKELLLLLEFPFPVLAEKKLLQGFPLFPLCMIGGLIIQLFLSKTKVENPVDHGLSQRLSGTALDFLVVAAISTIRLSVVLDNIIPLAIIIAFGVGWNVFCVLFLAKRLLPDHWFERAIAEMGQSMGVTATGLLLLRVVDPEGETGVLQIFGYKQLLHEPIMGGGLWTSIAIPLAITTGSWPVFFISLGAVAVWFMLWAILFRKR